MGGVGRAGSVGVGLKSPRVFSHCKIMVSELGGNSGDRVIGLASTASGPASRRPRRRVRRGASGARSRVRWGSGVCLFMSLPIHQAHPDWLRLSATKLSCACSLACWRSRGRGEASAASTTPAVGRAFGQHRTRTRVHLRLSTAATVSRSSAVSRAAAALR